MTTLMLAVIGSGSCFRVDSRVPLQRVPNSCVTLTGKTCVFPFKYKDVEYYQCTYADSPLAWCATETDSSGNVITGKWDDCSVSQISGCTQESITVPSCTTTSGPQSGQACVFPFRYKGKVYTECATEDQSAAWCSTEVDVGGNFVDGKYGFCPSTCPVNGAVTSTTTTTTSTTTSSSVTSTTTVTTSTTTTATTTTTTMTTTTTTGSSSGTCTTSSGPAAGQACVFPFTFSGVTYNSCAEWIYGGQPSGTTWCSTKVDSNGVHVNNEGNYGFCPTDSACTTSVAPKAGVRSGAVVFNRAPPA